MHVKNTWATAFPRISVKTSPIGIALSTPREGGPDRGQKRSKEWDHSREEGQDPCVGAKATDAHYTASQEL